MTEDTGGTPDPTAAPGETPAASAEPTESIDGLKSALSTERNTRKNLEKQLRDFEGRIAEFESRDKTELEKAAARAETAEAKLADLERRDMARTIATEAGIPDLWDALHGDEDNMRSLAKRLAERAGAAAGDDTTPDLGAGARGGEAPKGSSGFSAQIRRDLARRR